MRVSRAGRVSRLLAYFIKSKPNSHRYRTQLKQHNDHNDPNGTPVVQYEYYLLTEHQPATNTSSYVVRRTSVTPA